MSAPAYVLRLEPREHYLYAHVAGPEDTFEVSLAYWGEIAEACRAGAVRRLLVVEALAGNVAAAEMEEVVEALIPLGFRDLRLAFVDATEDVALLVGAEIRAQRAGLVVRTFRREGEARDWLLAEALRADGDAAAVVPA